MSNKGKNPKFELKSFTFFWFIAFQKHGSIDLCTGAKTLEV